jgi:hypothetical protein
MHFANLIGFFSGVLPAGANVRKGVLCGVLSVCIRTASFSQKAKKQMCF